MNKDEAIKSIKRYHYTLADIPEKEWSYMEQNLIRFKVFDAGQTFCNQGDEVNTVGYLAQGLFESIHLDDEDGSSIIQKFYNSGSSIAPYASLLSDTPSDVSIVALEKSYMYLIKYKDIQELYKRHECWQTVGRRLGENEYMAKNKREKELLAKTPEERYQIFIKENRSLAQKISDKKIAQYLGINNVSLSRIKKRIALK